MVSNVRISMWTDSFYPYISGVTRSVATTRETLERMGHKVTVFCPSYPGTTPEEGVYRFQSVKAPTKPDFYIAFPANPKHLIALGEISPDIIHIHSPFNLGKTGLRMGRLLKIPVVFTYHTMYNMYSHYIPVIGQMASELVEAGSFITAKQADAVIAPSTAIRDYLLQHNVKTKVFVIPTGINVDRFRHGDPDYICETFNIPPQVPVLLSCGRLGPEKNPETLIKAFALIHKHMDCYLVMIGDGPLHEALRGLANKLGVGHRVVFAGKVPPDLMPHMYAGSDVFLFASLTDTQGLVIVEAKSAGVPCVAVGALGVKDMVEHDVDGYLCENAPEDLAQKTLALLQDPERLSTMKSNALANASRFSLETTCNKLVECYMEVAEGL
jgi:1,2-diacylglycerol 3-alpha-glucosyltransferase